MHLLQCFQRAALKIIINISTAEEYRIRLAIGKHTIMSLFSHVLQVMGPFGHVRDHHHIYRSFNATQTHLGLRSAIYSPSISLTSSYTYFSQTVHVEYSTLDTSDQMRIFSTQCQASNNLRQYRLNVNQARAVSALTSAIISSLPDDISTAMITSDMPIKPHYIVAAVQE